MCRLIAIINPKDNGKTAEAILRQFGALAKNGVVPPGTDVGHKDGWGIVAYKDKAFGFLEKNSLAAFEDPTYEIATAKAEKTDPSLILGHLRKASQGEISMENTQPYRFGQYAFCHNGTVRNFKEIILEPKYLRERKGTADSEVVFLYLLQKIEAAGNFIDGFIEGIKHLRSMDYTGLNILMSDGKTLLALREVNTDDEKVRDNNLCNTYYTLLRGKNDENITRFICSQALDIPNITWVEIPNHSVFVFDVSTNKENLIEL